MRAAENFAHKDVPGEHAKRSLKEKKEWGANKGWSILFFSTFFFAGLERDVSRFRAVSLKVLRCKLLLMVMRRGVVVGHHLLKFGLEVGDVVLVEKRKVVLVGIVVMGVLGVGFWVVMLRLLLLLAAIQGRLFQLWRLLLLLCCSWRIEVELGEVDGVPGDDLGDHGSMVMRYCYRVLGYDDGMLRGTEIDLGEAGLAVRNLGLVLLLLLRAVSIVSHQSSKQR